jgi:lipoyl(octanoyl) transferase
LWLKIRNRREDLELPTQIIFFCAIHMFIPWESGDLSNLLLSEKQLETKGATFYKINRGGDITYHGPGQIVGYPILDLENFFTDIHKYYVSLKKPLFLR